jgi:hypothetical protein
MIGDPFPVVAPLAEHAGAEQNLRQRVGVSQLPGFQEPLVVTRQGLIRVAEREQCPGQPGRRRRARVASVKQRERAVPGGTVKRKGLFEVRPGRKQLPNVMCVGADNPVSYHPRASRVLSLGKAQQFVGYSNGLSVRRACRVKGPLTKSTGKSRSVSPSRRHSSRARV